MQPSKQNTVGALRESSHLKPLRQGLWVSGNGNRPFAASLTIDPHAATMACFYDVLRQCHAESRTLAFRLGLFDPLELVEYFRNVSGGDADAIITHGQASAFDLIIKWGTKTIERMPKASRNGERFLMRLGLDPFTALANAYEAQGKLDKAADAYRTAIKIQTGMAYKYWLHVIRLEQKLGRDDKVLAACKAALKLRPHDEKLKTLHDTLAQKLKPKPAPATQRPAPPRP